MGTLTTAYGIELRFEHEHDYKGKFHRTVISGSDVTVQWGPLQYMEQMIGAGECTNKVHRLGSPDEAAKRASALVASKIAKGYRPRTDLTAFALPEGVLGTGVSGLHQFTRARNLTSTVEETVDLILASEDEATAGYLIAVAAMAGTIDVALATRLASHPSDAVRKAISRKVTLAAIS